MLSGLSWLGVTGRVRIEELSQMSNGLSWPWWTGQGRIEELFRAWLALDVSSAGLGGLDEAA